MKRFDLYGWRSLTPTEAAQLVEAVTGATLVRHESGYHGGDYFRHEGLDVEELILQANFEDEERYLAEPDFSGFSTLLYVTGPTNELRTKLAGLGLVLLRTELL
jgi:hypothetical protein